MYIILYNVFFLLPDRPRAIIRFTPLLSIIVGIISTLVIVALVVIVVLRLQCARNRPRKTHKIRNGASSEGSISGTISSDKGNTSPISKHDSSGGDGNDSDEKNPDIIPQPDTDDRVDFFKRQHISTIETSSPPRRLHQPPNNLNYMGYCTLRNGTPMRDMRQPQKMVSFSIFFVTAHEGTNLNTRTYRWVARDGNSGICLYLSLRFGDWVVGGKFPGHFEYEGNERAHELARQGSETSQIRPEPERYISELCAQR